MRTPQELLTTLHEFEDATSAISVYKEAVGYIKAFKEVQQAALDCAAAEMQSDGVLHTKTDFGTAGWTKPRTPRLDRDIWAGMIARNEQLKQLQDEADQATARLEQAQHEAGCFFMPEPRFYIR
jgi:hypothetical protein